MKPVFLIALLCLTGIMLVGCGQVVPPGKVVIILSADGKSRIVTKGVYRSWGRDRLYFVDGKLQSYTEKLQILCEDDINMAVDVKAVMSFQITKDSVEFIKAKVPTKRVNSGDVKGYELSLNEFYNMAVKDVIRGTTRNVVSQYKTDDIRPNRQKIEADISNKVRERLKQLNYPLSISAILVSNIDYPRSVQKMREEIKQVQLEEQRKAAAAQADLAEAKRRVLVETEKGKVRMVQARAKAEENRILSEALTPAFLTWRQYEVMEKVATALAAGQSNTVFMMPYQLMDQKTLNAAMIRNAMKKNESVKTKK